MYPSDSFGGVRPSGASPEPEGISGGSSFRTPPAPGADDGDAPVEGAPVPPQPPEPAEETGSADGPPEIADLPLPEAPASDPDAPRLPRLTHFRKGRRLVRKAEEPSPRLTPEQRLLLLDTWQKSGLPAGDFADLVGLSKHTLYSWKWKFEEHGPQGLLDQPHGRGGGRRVPEITRRTILLLKKTHPDYGLQKIADLLVRGPGLPVSPNAVAKVLHEEGYELEERPTAPHPDHPRRFEKERPSELWQSDLFTFTLKRQNRRIYLTAFLDDHSRFVVGWGLYASQSTPLVIEVLRAAVSRYGPPQEVLTDNGAQYVTWRGTSAFARELSRLGIRHRVSSPRHPQTCGKIERFWGSLWREFLEGAVFRDLEDARVRIGHYVDHYNFHRPHQALEGLTPADRFFGAASEVRRALEARVARNAFELARDGAPKAPFYMAGHDGDRAFSVHREGERLIVVRGDGTRQEVDLGGPGGPQAPRTPQDVEAGRPAATGLSEASGGDRGAKPPGATAPRPVTPDGSPPPGLIEEAEESGPGESPLDEGLRRLTEAFGGGGAAASAVPPAPPQGPPPPAPAAGGDPDPQRPRETPRADIEREAEDGGDR